MMIPSITMGDGTICLSLNYKPYQVSPTHQNYDEIRALLMKGAPMEDEPIEEILNLINIKKVVENILKQQDTSHPQYMQIDIDTGRVTFDGHDVAPSLCKRILELSREGHSVDSLIKFTTKLYQNPSNTAIRELYQFMEVGKLPITETGNFLAYKRVNTDYTDIHTSTMDNSVGATVSMPRHLVNDDSSVTCSHGLHICSFEYLQHFSGARVVVVEVHPKDVVSVPKDYDDTKCRVCEYTVVADITDEVDGGPVLNTTVDTRYALYRGYFATDECEEEEIDPIITSVTEGDILNGLLAQAKEWREEQDRIFHEYNMSEECEEESEDEVDPTSQNVWYNCGYTIGFAAARSKTIAPMFQSGQAIRSKLRTIILGSYNAVWMNQGLICGMKDGRGHKKRAVPITELTSLPS
jgi:hypothetical protein